MKNIIFSKKSFIGLIGGSLLILLMSSPQIFAQESDAKEIFGNVEKISEATKMIEDKKYPEAVNVLNSITDTDFYYLKNQHLGDIAYLNGKYDEAISFYNLAQFHSKDKIMNDYMTKKIAYIMTVKQQSDYKK